MKAFNTYEDNWSKISEEVKDGNSKANVRKDPSQCKDRISKLVMNTLKGTWTMEEDNIILKYYSKFGRNWALIASRLKGRSGKQVRERFVNYLEKKESKKNEDFTVQED